MRRGEREVKDKKEIEDIIQKAEVCRIGFSENGIPYIVPVDFGYRDNCLYVHCATEGKKLDIIRENNVVCFEMDIDHQMVKPAGRPCGWSTKYRSVIGVGRAFILEEFKEKSTALNIITQHYGGDWYDFSEEELKKVGIIKIAIQNMTGKKSGY